MKQKDEIITMTKKKYSDIIRRGYRSDNVWDYVSIDKKILNADKIIELLDEYYESNESYAASDLYNIANMSNEGRLLIRRWLKHQYDDIASKKPNSFFNKIDINRRDRLIDKGKDPYDVWYDENKDNSKTIDASNFFRLLASFLRIFA